MPRFDVLRNITKTDDNEINKPVNYELNKKMIHEVLDGKPIRAVIKILPDGNIFEMSITEDDILMSYEHALSGDHPITLVLGGCGRSILYNGIRDVLGLGNVVHDVNTILLHCGSAVEMGDDKIEHVREELTNPGEFLEHVKTNCSPIVLAPLSLTSASDLRKYGKICTFVYPDRSLKDKFLFRVFDDTDYESASGCWDELYNELEGPEYLQFKRLILGEGQLLDPIIYGAFNTAYGMFNGDCFIPNIPAEVRILDYSSEQYLRYAADSFFATMFGTGYYNKQVEPKANTTVENPKPTPVPESIPQGSHTGGIRVTEKRKDWLGNWVYETRPLTQYELNSEIAQYDKTYEQHPAKIISGFPGVGKTTLRRHFLNLYMAEDCAKIDTISDSDSSSFSWKIDDTGERVRNPDFAHDYVEHIKSRIDGGCKLLFISTHETIRDELDKQFIDYIIVYPDKSRKDEFMKNYRERGNDEAFLSTLSANWDAWIDAIESDERHIKFKLTEGQYLNRRTLGILTWALGYAQDRSTIWFSES